MTMVVLLDPNVLGIEQQREQHQHQHRRRNHRHHHRRRLYCGYDEAKRHHHSQQERE